MAEIMTICSKLITVFIYVGLGYAIMKLKVVDDKFMDKFPGFITKFTIPCLFVATMQIDFTMDTLGKAVFIFLASMVMYAACMLIGFISAKIMKIRYEDKSVWIYSAMFSSHGFMGFPLFIALLGQESLFFATFANAAMNMAAYSMGAWVMKKYGGFHRFTKEVTMSNG